MGEEICHAGAGERTKVGIMGALAVAGGVQWEPGRLIQI